MHWILQITLTGFRLRSVDYGVTCRGNPRFNALLED